MYTGIGYKLLLFQASGAGTVSNDFLELLLFGTPRYVMFFM